jgi:hypothetical protein
MFNPLRRFLPSRRVMKIIGMILLPIFLFLGWLVFWPWDDPPPQDADLRLPERPKIAAMDNGYTYFIQAEKKFFHGKLPGKDGTEKYLDDIDLSSNHGAFDSVLAKAFLDVNIDSLALIEKALACQAWEYPQEDLGWIYKRCYDMRRSMELLQIKIRLELLAGNYEKAAAVLSQEINLCQVMLKGQSDSLIFRTALGFWDMNDCLSLAWDPQVPESVLIALEKDLAQMDNPLLTTTYRDTMRKDYQAIIEAFKTPNLRPLLFLNFIYGDCRPDKPPWFVPAYCFKPNKTLRMIADGQRGFIAHAGLPYTEFKQRVLTGTPFRHEDDRWHMVFKPNSLGQLVYENTCTRHEAFGSCTGLTTWKQGCRTLACLSAIRLTIACKRYERKYGNLPETLEKLVPEFIPVVPTDPFDGKPMRYSREQRLIWSVGLDGQDNDGRMMHGTPFYWGSSDNERYDFVCPLDRPPPKPPKPK